MSQTIKIKKGFDINLAGKAEKTVAEIQQPETFALKPTDFVAISKPKVLVKEGDNVKAGTPLLYEKTMEQVLYTAPVSGEVVEVKRGAKRKLLEIKILADKEIEYEKFDKYSSSDLQSIKREDAVQQLIKSGVWPMIIQRPFGIVAAPEDSPKSIFISGFDTAPNSADVDFILKGEEQNFQAGINVLNKLTDGDVHLGLNADGEASSVFAQLENVKIHKFSGPHPTGNVGTQIHEIAPISKGDLIWTVSPYGVALIGRLFLEGKYDARRTIAITGSEIKKPQYVKTYIGACLDKILADNVKSDHVRYVSGNVLTGENVGKEGYLGYYHNQINVIPEGDEEEFLGWIKPTTSKLSFHRAFGILSFLNGNKKEYVLDTNTHGEERGFVVTGVFEKVMPMDILPTYLFKSIMAKDYDDMEGLGIYEVIEEDVALCEFVDPSKQDLQDILREGIELIRNS